MGLHFIFVDLQLENVLISAGRISTFLNPKFMSLFTFLVSDHGCVNHLEDPLLS